MGRRKVHDPMVRDLVEDPAECPKNSISRGLEVTLELSLKG